MPLDWTFSFLQVNIEANEKPNVLFVISYQDGKFLWFADESTNQTYLSQMDTVAMLCTYIAFFPGKNFTKIKLRTNSRRFAIHFLDKRYLDSGFLGILSVSEFDVASPFESWGVEEMMSEYIFEFYRDVAANSLVLSEQKEVFLEWLGAQVDDFYLDWKEAKAKIHEGNKITLHSKEFEEKYEQMWDLQLINAYGMPITSKLSFINGNSFFYSDEDEMLAQNLDSMSISAIKMLIDTQGEDWNIEYLKARLDNEMGFQYTFFKQITINHMRFLWIMNSSIYDLNTQTCLQIFRGNEFQVLDQIADRLGLKSDLFTDNGALKEFEDNDPIRLLILTAVTEFYE